MRGEAVPRRASLLVPAFVLAVFGLVPAGSAAGSFQVKSTLDGKTVLPHRIHWDALPSLPAAQVLEVDFLIDGKLVWVAGSKAPYSFADDGGYLVTSWLAPGEHRFVVRAFSHSGVMATDTVVARVVPPPEVPAALAGTWERNVSDVSGAPKTGTNGNPTDTIVPPGTYRMTFGPEWIRDTFPCDDSPCTYNQSTGAGALLDDDWTPGAKTFYVQGQVTTHIPKDTARLAGWWCETWGRRPPTAGR
jgi:hypothetical protein